MKNGTLKNLDNFNKVCSAIHLLSAYGERGFISEDLIYNFLIVTVTTSRRNINKFFLLGFF